MKIVQERLNKELEAGNSIADWAIGYYISEGGLHGFNLKISVFDIPNYLKSYTNYPQNKIVKVLVDYLGSMMWINIRLEQLKFGLGNKQQGKDLRRELELIKANS